MRVVLVVGVILATVSSATAAVASPVVNYHDAIGFKLAAKIKADEDVIMRRLHDTKTEVNMEDRIIGGAIAPANMYPFLGGLLIYFSNTAGVSYCGSSLLSASRLVTAAHCWRDGLNTARLFEVVLGSQYIWYGPRIATQTVFMHPSYIPGSLQNDIAMIYLPTPVSLSQQIQPIALPSGNALWDTFAGRWGVAIGYGRIADVSLPVTQAQVRHVNLNIISVAECQAWFGAFAQPSNICTSGAGIVGICQGDSGGPLIVNHNGQNILVGVSSFVDGRGCTLGTPSGFARVTSFISFIQQHMW